MTTLRNGYIPATALVNVQDGIQLETATAAAFLRAKAENPRIRIASPAGGYRSYFVQGDMKKRPWLYGLNSSSSVGLAAPGYSSHGQGTRVDIVGDNPWFLANAHRFGFRREFGAADPNHYEFLSPTWANAPKGSAPSGGGVTPVPTIQEDDMIYLVACTDKRVNGIWRVTTAGARHLTPAELGRIRADYPKNLIKDINYGPNAVAFRDFVQAVAADSSALPASVRG